MPQVAVFGQDDEEPMFVREFDFLPRLGESISKDAGGFFHYFTVVQIWHREDAATGKFTACVAVEPDEEE